jgi:hypothetical protein
MVLLDVVAARADCDVGIDGTDKEQTASDDECLRFVFEEVVVGDSVVVAPSPRSVPGILPIACWVGSMLDGLTRAAATNHRSQAEHAVPAPQSL